MTETAQLTTLRDIKVDEIFPHAAATLWRTLTTPELMGRWLMAPTGFEPVVGNRFTFQTTAKGEWDGVIHCEVLEIEPNERLVYSWRGGHESNEGYGALLETVVRWTLSQTEAGTRVQLSHEGFQLPQNEVAFTNMRQGWVKVVEKVGELSANSPES